MTKQQVVPADELAMSPELAALPSARMRAFVDVYCTIHGAKPISAAGAARAAGYSPDGDAHQLSAQAQKLMARPDVQAAIAAESVRRHRSLLPNAVHVARKIMNNDGHKDQYKAAAALIERADPTVQRVDAHVVHEVVDHRKEALAQIQALKELGVSRDKLEEMFGFTGLASYERQLSRQRQGH